ncbi:Carbamoyltransferase HypF [Microbulbifer aggregans]|uniref:Carbamoyltransferase HypF n=1 Tax=Microbulbifer aggregans TaxID=1769779 RepID=A0A1C9W9V5_9GAMM|nr:carbamoyltransferase HypF [Microbulbifer aggregans]AOS97937.1 Carbamoyltransferase HypF [Microbulbifer aggregans]
MTVKAERWAIDINGVVQGVGFRPFILRLAQHYDLTGWVANNSQGVHIEAQGPADSLREFLDGIRREKPPHAEILELQVQRIACHMEEAFSIRTSKQGGLRSATLLPDLAPCDACLSEMFDPANHRFHYPFTNCTNCGPRFSIVESLPYDRANTSMNSFPMCPQCKGEYRDSANRRFHAEPNACPTCGPQLQLLDNQGQTLATTEDGIRLAASALCRGDIVALKSVGGFQLLVDATNTKAVRRLRRRKQRPAKPFALLYPDIESLRADCHISTQEEALLCSQARPIVLLRSKKKSLSGISPQVAPENPNLGAMLPCSGLHHLLMSEFKRPVVATSGNLAGEPICTENAEAIERLGGIADLFLVHDRTIVRPIDDSVARIIGGQPQLLRRARGYAPLPIELPGPGGAQGAGDLLAVGANLKNTVAICRGSTVYCSQHIGDLDERRSSAVFEQTIGDLTRFYDLQIESVLCDLHPTYASSRWAAAESRPYRPVQHHVAHFFSAMAEHKHHGSALGICWDGTGYGQDGVIRGGEFLLWNGGDQVRHFASLAPFPLPGGDTAIRQPRRSAAGLLHTAFGTAAFTRSTLRALFKPEEIRIIARMLDRNLNSPLCTSVGRLFDAVAALLGLAGQTTFEGQAAMAVEFAAQRSRRLEHYPFECIENNGEWTLGWQPMLAAMLEEQAAGAEVEDIASAFQNTLVEMVVALAVKASHEQIFLSGGVFQNRVLTEATASALTGRGFDVHTHRLVPPNDGGIALGQIYYGRTVGATARPAEEGSTQCA